MAASGAVHESGQRIKFLDTITIGAAVTGSVTTPVKVLSGVNYVGALAVFVYAAGGTTAKFWLQTSFDGGATWMDIANFAFTTASLTKFSAMTTAIAPATQAAAPTDATLADNTINQGTIGSQFRVKYTTTGTYTGVTTIALNAVLKG